MGTYNKNNKHLNVKDFQHPADRKSIDAVMAIPGLEKILEFVSHHSLERTYGFINNSSRMKITQNMSPKIHKMLEEATEMYGETYIPEVYLERNYTFLINLDGMTKPYIVLPDTWLEVVDDQMLFAILSAQIAGIQAKHATIEFIENIINFTKGMLPFGVDAALEFAINDWKRNRVYTADRAILLAEEDFGEAAKHILFGDVPNATIQTMDLVSPGNSYQQQALEFLSRSGLEGGIQKVETLLSGGQWLASRYIELYNWYYSGAYDEVLERSVEE